MLRQYFEGNFPVHCLVPRAEDHAHTACPDLIEDYVFPENQSARFTFGKKARLPSSQLVALDQFQREFLHGVGVDGVYQLVNFGLLHQAAFGQLADERIEAAKATLEADPNVKALKDMFGAEINADSIELLNPTQND